MDLIAFSHLTEVYEASGGERPPESDYGFHTWTGHIHAGCTGCITRALHPCDMLRRLQEVHGQMRPAHGHHTGDFHAGSRRFPYGQPGDARQGRMTSLGTRFRTYPRT